MQAGELAFVRGRLSMACLDFAAAREFFAAARTSEGKPDPRAEAAVVLMERIEATGVTAEEARRTGLSPALTRGEMAELLADVLDVRQVLGIPGQSGNVVALDLNEQWYAPAARICLELDIFGLGLYEDDTFRGDIVLSRAEIAVILAGILHRAENIAPATDASESVYANLPDLQPEYTFYDEAVFMLEQGILSPITYKNAELFLPLAPLSGVDALQAVSTARRKIGGQ